MDRLHAHSHVRRAAHKPPGIAHAIARRRPHDAGGWLIVFALAASSILAIAGAF